MKEAGKPALPSCVMTFFRTATAGDKLQGALTRMAAEEQAGQISEASYKEVIDALFQGNAKQQAVSFLSSAVNCYPDSAAFHRQLIECLDQTGQLAQAVQHAEQTMASGNDDVAVGAAVALAAVHKRRGGYAESAEVLEKSLADHRSHPELFLHLGIVNMLQDDMPKAMTNYQACIDAAGDDPKYTDIRDKAYMFSGLPKPAQASVPEPSVA